MADVIAVNETARRAGTKIDVSLDRGILRVINDTYEAVSVATTDVIVVGSVREGEVIQLNCSIVCDAMGTSTTLGLALRRQSDDAITILIDPITSNTAKIIEPDAADAIDLPLEVADDSDIIVQIAGAAITGTVKTNVVLTNVN